MAYYEQDPMGNFTGGQIDQEAEAIALREEEEKKRKEEEERQRKEEERIAKERDNLAVHKQEVTTYANGSKTITNVAEVPADARAPGRPVSGPVAPGGFQGQTDEFGGVDEAVARQAERQAAEERQAEARPDRAPVAPVAPGTIFERQIQAESGGQHINPRTGQIMTSPKGALGVAQIMPATARNPGYGIAPITEEELRTPEGNRAFGERYKEAMLRVFNGDEEKATASYNAGPGAVQKAVKRAEQQGGDYKDYLPTETKNYLQKVFGGQQQQRPQTRAVAPVAPVAPGQTPQPDSVINDQVAAFEQRQQRPAAQAAAPEAVSPYSLSTGRGEPGLRMPGAQPTGVATSARAIDAYQASQNDPGALMKLGTSDDPSVPDFIKERSRNRAADIITQDREMARAKEVVANSSETDLAKYLRKKTEDGSYLKLALYGLLGMEKSGQAEAAKLGIGDDKSVMGADGKAYIVKTSANGTLLEGYDAANGKKLTADQLVTVSAGATAAKGVHQAGDVYKDPTGKVKGSFVLETRPGQTPVYKEVGTGRIATAEEGAVLNKTGVAGTLENQLASQRQKLMEQMRYVEPTKRMEIAAKFDQENGTNFARQLKEEMPTFFGGGAPTATAEAPARAPTAAVAPTALPPAAAGAAPVAQAAPAGGPVAPGQVPTAAAPTTQAGILAERERQKREAEANTQVSVDARKDYNAYVDKELVAKVPNATKISRIRSAQLDGPDGLVNVPEIAGIMASGGSAGREVGNIIRDMLTGQFTSVEDLNKRVVGLNLQGSNPKVYNALMTQIRLQQELGPLTIKETAPVGAISDSEQKMNTSNQVDVTRNPAYVTFNLLSKNKFQTDLTQAKADFAAKNPELNTIAKFNQAWTKEEGKLNKQYDDIYAARAAYVGEYKNTPKAAVAAYKLFPVPAWNAEKGSFEYKGQPYAKKRPALDSFVK